MVVLAKNRFVIYYRYLCIKNMKGQEYAYTFCFTCR